jgi:hypothetical protein
MITIGDHHTGDLFDPWAHLGAKRRALLEKSWAGVVRAHFAGNLPVREIAPFFHDSHGRPGKDLHVALGVLFLQQMHDLSDAATVEAMAFNEAWHYALDARTEDDRYVCERTVRNYRAKVVATGADQILFRDMTDRLIKAFGVDVTRQRLDSTAVCSNMRKLTRLGVMCRTIETFLREVRRADGELYGRIDPALLERHVSGEEGGCFGNARPSEARRRLPQAAADLLALVRCFAGTAAAGLPGYPLMQRVLGEQCQVIPAGGGEDEKLRVKEDGELGGDVLQNPSDPDSTYNRHKGQGYTVQVMETYQPQEPGDVPEALGKQDQAGERIAAPPAEDSPLKPDLITHVAIGPMTGHDNQAVEPALEDVAARGILPGQLLADTHYGAQEQVEQAMARGVELIAPAQPPAGSRQEPSRLSLEQFILDADGKVKQCPAGCAPLSVSVSKAGNYQACFDAATCAACPLRSRCPVQNPRSATDGKTRLQYDEERLPMRQRRLGELEPPFTERYRWRAGIEGSISRLKHQIGWAALRVRGLAAMGYEAFMGALALNVLRCARCVSANAAA